MVGIIAGSGSLPIAVCHELHKQHRQFCVVNLFPELDDTALRTAAKTMPVIGLSAYKVADILALLKAQRVNEVIMIGKVDKKLLLKNIRLDWLALKLLASVPYKKDQAILQKIVDELGHHGITVLRQHDILIGKLIPPGVLCGTLTDELKQQLSFGMELAQNIAKLDIGQTVVIKDNMVISVEAIEGTDTCIRRGIDLAGGGVIVCKTAQAFHNPQFDLPTLGSSSLLGIQPGDIKAICWLASHTLIADLEQFVTEAEKLNVTLVAL